MKIVCDSTTEEYLREIIAIHARRMILENVDCWWLDRPLMVVFAGLIKAQQIKLPLESCDQAKAVALFCFETCEMKKIDPSLFCLCPDRTKAWEYSMTLKKVEMNLLIV